MSHRIHSLGPCVKQRGHQAPPNCEGHITGCPWNNGSTIKLPSSPTKHVQPVCRPTPVDAYQGLWTRQIIALVWSTSILPNRALNSYDLEVLLALMLRWCGTLYPSTVDRLSHCLLLNVFKNWFRIICYCILFAYQVIVIPRLWFTCDVGNRK